MGGHQPYIHFCSRVDFFFVQHQIIVPVVLLAYEIPECHIGKMRLVYRHLRRGQEERSRPHGHQ